MARNKKVTVAQGIQITQKQHTALVDHLTGLLQRFDKMRTARNARFENIDREFNGYLELDDEDKKTEQENNQGKGIKPTPTKLMLADGQVDEIVTYLLSVLVPDSDMYTAVTEKDKQQIAEAFTAVMNQHGDLFDHYSNYAQSFLNALKYNMAGLLVEWHKVEGQQIKAKDGGAFDVAKGVTFEGNQLTSVDPYNVIYDQSVPFKKLHSHGEFFATVAMKTTFSVKRMAQLEEIYLPKGYEPARAQGQQKYYKDRPNIHRENFPSGKGNSWFDIFAQGSGSSGSAAYEVGGAHEFTTIYAWLPPSFFGLSTTKEMEIWRFILLDNQMVVHAQKMQNAHGFLPLAPIRPMDDGFEDQSVTLTEKLLPMQRFASFLINVHQHATRKSLYGLNIYDQSMINLEEIPKEDLMAGYIPAKATDQKPLDRALKQFNDTPDTSGTLNDIENILGLMQVMVPSNIAQQVAGLERATIYQTAATVQGSNRRNLKLAKTINAQGMIPCRQMQAVNLMQFQPDMEMTDPRTGNKIQVDPGQFRETDMVFTISEGLKGIDRLLVIEGLKDVINMLLQSGQAERIDIVAVIDHWLSMFGDLTDFKQFEFESAIDGLTPEQKVEAMQAYQERLAEQQGQQGTTA